jgi:hypothetical protein
MAYTKKTWVKGSTPLSAENFNHMEQGIADAHTEITQLNSDISNVNDALANTDTKLQLSNIKTLSLNWKDGVLEFYVDGTRIFGINARWNGGTI